MPPERQRLLQNLSVYRGAFVLEAAQAMSDEAVAQTDIRRLVKRSLLQERRRDGIWIFQFQPLIQQFLQHHADDLSDAHQRAIGYYLGQCQPLLPNTSPDGAVTPYLEAFYHGIKLGAYVQAWNFIQQQTSANERYSSVPMFLKFRGIGTERLQELNLYQQLIGSWQPQDDQEQNLLADALKAIGDVEQFLKQSREALAHYEDALRIYREVGARLGEANTLKAIGDVEQFLKQSREALAHYEDALRIYREVGARLGEANTLLELGRLLDDAHQSLEMYESAQTIYVQIGDRYSQARTLFMYISDALLALGNVEGAIAALAEVAEISQSMGFEAGRDAALQKIEEIQALMASDK